MIVSFSYLEGNYKKDELNLFCVTPEDSMKGHWVKVMRSIFQLNRKKDFLIISSVLKWNEIPQKSNHHSRRDIQQTPYAGGPWERFLLPAGDWTKWPLRTSLLLKVYDSLSCFLSLPPSWAGELSCVRMILPSFPYPILSGARLSKFKPPFHFLRHFHCRRHWIQRG